VALGNNDFDFAWSLSAARQKYAATGRSRAGAGLIDRLLNAANKPGEKTKAEGTPVKEVSPAK
jgi:hypothetical protein